jgi:hypothetical protein
MIAIAPAAKLTTDAGAFGSDPVDLPNRTNFRRLRGRGLWGRSRTNRTANTADGPRVQLRSAAEPVGILPQAP